MVTMRVYRPAVARLLLLVQLFMLTNAVVFRHAHRLPDGTIVVHAHPFLPKALGGPPSDPVQPNNHSRQELIWLDALAHTPYLVADVLPFGWLVVGTLVPDQQRVGAVVAGSVPVASYRSLRGPPLV